MRPVLLDTNAYTAFKLGDANIIEIVQHAETIVMTPIVLGELLSGFDNGSKSKKNREELQQFLSSSRVCLHPISADTANFYSKIYVALRKKGKTIPSNDLWIAAQTMEHGFALCTYDGHFNEIDGLLVGSCYSQIAI